MGRLREFEDKDALAKAVTLFWEKGYESTSLKELLDTMNILNGSFYHSFGSKKNLFIKALESYNDEFKRKRNLVLDTNQPLQKKLKTIFKHVLDRQEDAVCPKGCFLFNSVSSDTLSDPEISKLLRHFVGEFEDSLEQQIRMAIASGEVKKEVDAAKAASVLIIYMQGLMRICTLEYEAKLKSQTDYFLQALLFF